MKKMDKRSEQLTIEKAAAGDSQAAGDLVRAHQASLYAYMLRMSTKPDVAEDIVQEAFVRVLSNLDRFDPRFRFSTWLFTIAKRLYLNRIAKMSPHFDSDLVGAAGSGSRTSERFDAPETSTHQAETTKLQQQVLVDALAHVSEQQREIVVLFHQHDWPIARIAEHMDMPEGTIKSHLHRARKKLRQYIESSEDTAAVAVCAELLAACA